MKFPTWVDEPKRQTKAQLATKRLKYLIERAVIEKGCGSIGGLAANAGVDRTSIHKHIEAGRFSEVMATTLESFAGAELLPRQALTDPLAIVTTE